MLLYFDNLITNIPLIPGFYTELDAIRDSCKNYNTRDRYEITLYTLASYAELDWSEVIIVYEFGKDLIHKKNDFERFVKKLFPKAHLFYGRSDNQKKFQERVNFINKFDDEWIFYAGNNDHPFICPNFDILKKCLKKARELSKKWEFVSIVYSHFSETYNIARSGTAIHDLSALYKNSKILKENKNLIVSLFPKGWNSSIQIVNKKLLNRQIFSKNLGEKIIRRIDEIGEILEIQNQIIIIPKQPVCEHFDGYSHTKFYGFSISSSIVPPLFIPEGFFERKIKIRYGYNDYKEGWVNINPSNPRYIFEDKTGTDLKISIKDIPLFWGKRISKIDVNKKVDQNKLDLSANKNFELIKLPFKSKKDRDYFKHIIKYKLKRKIYGSKLSKPFYILYKKSKILKDIHEKINELIFSS